MLDFLLEDIKNGVVTYSYIPYKSESFKGWVVVNEDDGSLLSYELSGHEHDRRPYACVGHLLSKLEEFAKVGHFEESGFLAWA